MSDNLGSNLHKQQKGDFSKFNYSDLMKLLNSTATQFSMCPLCCQKEQTTETKEGNQQSVMTNLTTLCWNILKYILETFFSVQITIILNDQQTF